MKIKEIMTREIKSLSPETSAKDALQMLFSLQISGLPVVDEKKGLVGMFTEKDILNKILPSYLEKVGRFVYEENPKGIRNKVAELDKVKIKDIMRTGVVTVNEETSVCEVARLMLMENIRRMPVLNKEGKVTGMVSRGDVVLALTKES